MWAAGQSKGEAMRDRHIDAPSCALPNPSELLCALRGQYLRNALCRMAHDLTEVHHRMLVDESCSHRLRPRRRQLLAEIDTWADLNLSRSAVGARAHTETLAQTIDHIAAAAALAFHLLHTDDPAGILMHRQWTRLAELEVAYGDLVRDLQDGRRYLPTNPTRCEPVAATGPEVGFARLT